MLTVTIPMRLGQLRTDRDIFQKDIAAALGVHRSAVCRWESGAQVPSVYHVAVWAHFLGRCLVAVSNRGVIVAEGEKLADLAQIRKGAGVSQLELARRIGRPCATVATCERKAGPGTFLTTAQRHLEGLGCRVGLALAVAEAVA